jgi:hypothetical protein
VGQECTIKARVADVDEATRRLRDMGAEIEDVGRSTEEAGHKGGDAAKGATADFGSMREALNALPGSAASMIAGFASFDAVKVAFREFLDILKEIEEIQERLSGQTVELADASKKLSQQLGLTEDQSMKVTRDLMVAGGFDEATAGGFGIGAAIAIKKATGAGLLEGDNFKTAKQAAAFVGATDMDQQAASDLMRFLEKTGQLSDPEAAKAAMAKIKAAADESDAETIGDFVSQLLKGGTGMAQAGMSLEDILTVGVQAINVETSGDLAAQSMKDLETLATGAEDTFTREINRVAAQRGLDASKLTTGQRIGITRDILGGIETQQEEDRIRAMMSAERGLRLIKAYRGSNVEAVSGASEAAAAATAGDFEGTVADYKETVSYQDAASQARTKYADAVQGRETFFRDKLRREAKAYVERAKASGQFGVYRQLTTSDEALEESEMKKRLDQMVFELRESGLLTDEDLGAMEEAEEVLGPGNSITGFADQLLLKYARLVEKLRQKAAASERDKGQASLPASAGAAEPTTPAEPTPAEPQAAGATHYHINTANIGVNPGTFTQPRLTGHQ